MNAKNNTYLHFFISGNYNPKDFSKFFLHFFMNTCL